MGRHCQEMWREAEQDADANSPCLTGLVKHGQNQRLGRALAVLLHGQQGIFSIVLRGLMIRAK